MNLEEIKAREQAATPGPWIRRGSSVIDSEGYALASALLPEKHRTNSNAIFIASARTDIPALLAEVERLTAENEQNANYAEIYQDICDKYGKNFRMLLDKAKTLQTENATLGKMVNDYSAAKEKAESDYNTLSTLQERTNAENTTLKKALEDRFKELESLCVVDSTETYTTGYRNGHRNGQLELIKWILKKPSKAVQQTHETHDAESEADHAEVH